MAVGESGGIPDGIRSNADVGIVLDGKEFQRYGVSLYSSANDVILTDGIEGEMSGDLISKAFLIRHGKLRYTRPGDGVAWNSEEYDHKGRPRYRDRGPNTLALAGRMRRDHQPLPRWMDHHHRQHRHYNGVEIRP